MRHIVAIVFLFFAAAPSAHAADNSGVLEGIFHSYLKLANEGDVVAQYVVAQRYETGKGTEKDMEKALYWYEMAAKNNYPLALVKLEQYNKVKAPATAEPPSLAKSPTLDAEPAHVRVPAPKQAPAKHEPAKKPAAPPRETVGKPKEKSVKITIVS